MDLGIIVDIIAKVIDKFGDKCSPEDREKIKEVLLQFFQNEVPPAQVIGEPTEDLELIYSYSVSLYEGGKYKEAMPGFWRLFSLKPLDPRFSFGFAACLHKQKRYKEAIENYMVNARVDLNNPAPWGHMADCYIQLGELDMACTMLDKAIEIAGDDSKHETFRTQAKTIKEVLQSQTKGLNNQPAQNSAASVG